MVAPALGCVVRRAGDLVREMVTADWSASCDEARVGAVGIRAGEATRVSVTADLVVDYAVGEVEQLAVLALRPHLAQLATV